MFIKEIQLENYKCFEKQTFQFEKQFTTIIGDNGSGKTATLDGIATALRCWLSDIVKDYNIEIDENHIRFETVKNGSKYQIEKKYPSIIDVGYNFKIQNALFNWDNTIKLKTEGNSSKIQKSQSAFSTLRRELLTKENNELPVVAYYKTKRLFQVKQNLDLYPIDTRFKPYENCLDISINNNQVFEWIKRMTFIQLQEKELIPELEAVKNSLIKALQHLNPKKEIDLFFDVKIDNLIIRIGEEHFPFNALSDGYRNTLGMVADIAYRMAELNPNITTNSKGIVLIDELDLHLHPKWQRHIVGDLKRIFPNCQFIVTTHSPFIIQSLKSGELLKLDETPELEYEDFTTKSIEDIAEDEQGVTMPQRSIYLQEKYDAAKAYYQKLETMNGNMTKEQKKQLREELALLTERYADDVAYLAFLEQKRLVKEAQIQK